MPDELRYVPDPDAPPREGSAPGATPPAEASGPRKPRPELDLWDPESGEVITEEAKEKLREAVRKALRGG